jgi:hypothetical protein
LSWPQALLILGAVVTVCSGFAFAVRFSEADEQAVRKEMAVRAVIARTPAGEDVLAPEAA